MDGMSAATGRPLGGRDHLRQSIRDILTTRIGTRIMRRDYGSDLPNLVDRPMTSALRVDLFAATAIAIARWEKRVRLKRVALETVEAGRLTLALDLIYLPDGQPIRLDGIVVE